MNFSKLFSIIVVMLGLTAAALAVEEKFEENYKVEGAVKTERQIASEKDSEREPSSVVAPVSEEKTDEAPQPWLHKADTSPN
jgi:hypothetical protein